MKKRILAIILLVFIVICFLVPFLLPSNQQLEIDNPQIETMHKLENTTIYNDVLSSEIKEKMNQINLISNRRDWYIAYKKLIEDYSDVLDSPESIYDYYTEDELDLLFRVVQAEIGDYSFEQKCNVVSVIFNRLEHEKFDDTMYEILSSDQFATISNGRIYSVEVDDDTILACEYVFEFGDTTGGALFFDSNGTLNYRHLFNDNAHNFYDLGGYDE